MLGLDDYGSGSESDSNEAPKASIKAVLAPRAAKSSSSLLSSLPQPKKSGSSIALPPPAAGGLNLPAPKGTKSKRRDGPVKITVEALKPAEDDEDEPQAKRPRLETNGKRTGAGSSSLLGMLPAPKKVAPDPVAPPPKVLGGGAGSNDAGVVDASAPPVPPSVADDDDPNLSFLPAALRKPRTKPAPSISKSSQSVIPPTVAPQPAPEDEDDGTDFFGLGPKSSATSSVASASIGPSRSVVSAAPKVKEYEPPPPTPFDPYPGYYQMPSGEWKAYDPEYYKSWWKSMQDDSSGRDGKGWEGADSKDMESVDAAEELKKAQAAELERTKGLTAPPKVVQGVVPATVKQKSGGVARSRHQLHTLLVEAYTNRDAIEEKLAEGRRNRKEAGNKYGF